MRPRLLIALALLAVGGTAVGQRYLSGITWPEPPVVTPGDGTAPPSDALVLFDGKNFDEWNGAKGWKADEDGGFTAKGGLTTKKSFGNFQLHLEFASPKVVKGNGQGRGNNGVGLMGGRYEIQVLDSYNNKTYPEGSAASVYNQRPPMVNASRKPGEWQTYDIAFTTPLLRQGRQGHEAGLRHGHPQRRRRAEPHRDPRLHQLQQPRTSTSSTRTSCRSC